MKSKYIAIAALAFALVMGMTIAPASAYFTDQHVADGGVPVIAGPSTDIYEWVNGTTKNMVVTNAEDAAPAIVRVQSEYPTSVMKESVEFETASDWKLVDGWYVYQKALAPGAHTSAIAFTYDFNPIMTNEKRPPEVGNNYNVVLVYESQPAKYKADGSLDLGGWM